MRIQLGDFFADYYDLHEKLKSLKESYGKTPADPRSFGWATRQTLPKGITIGEAASRYLKAMVALKREVHLPCFSTEKIHEDSKIVIPWDVQTGLEEVINFVGNETLRATDVDWEPSKE